MKPQVSAQPVVSLIWLEAWIQNDPITVGCRL